MEPITPGPRSAGATWPAHELPGRPRGEAEVGKWPDFVTGGFAGPVCLAVTVVGIVLSILVWRRRGARSGLRGIAWSLLPLVAYLTHALGLVGRLVSAIVQFATAFVFSPQTWLGVVLVGVVVVLFLVSGGMPLARERKRRASRDRSGTANSGSSGPAGNGKASVAAVRNRAEPVADDDDLSDVRDILKRHGIS
jgi:hypothetical protein